MPTLIPSQATPRVAHPARNILGEGPLWDVAEQALYWVDIKGHRLQRLDAAGVRDWQFDEEITSVHRHAEGGFLVTLRHSIARLQLPEGTLEKWLTPEPELTGNRFNDAVVDASGSLWCGTMDDAERHTSGSLYRVRPDGDCQRQDSGYIVTNGPVLSPQGDWLYHTDTLERLIYRFAVDEHGHLSDREPFIRIPQDQGFPDGMTTDRDGNLWVCQFGGWRISVFNSQGRLVEDIPMPVANITSCTFGGPDLSTLYITTARKGLDDDALAAQPDAGALFVIETRAQGMPAVAFAAQP
ncbi:sugar lactone lactonase YvrE [Chromohalobacter marismortui]|uniref:Sugar lactone lactonase YvrE n=1 Tax=Chromohalobacter marismortui TaxID=42055 RepID=A0A4R7NVH1_9GAMM|nr:MULTISPECIES: SMP-30/gluconolactonase/LRE family protein [Chromohalobacter]MCI0511159.1 SMP-30/gluconolactonase/LRE family protein [Chromohalobacter sp.]MCI0593605.1 SMP-30/gluconolactonase/LRE family protein [Chromohalobacter sp.]TDU25184.1 sugar lactone lactonase YvrE [Chromohalobacter marismortui]